VAAAKAVYCSGVIDRWSTPASILAVSIRTARTGSLSRGAATCRRLGYARVSTYGQTLDAQLEQLRADGCAKVYREKASCAQADRRELLRMLKDITPGDVVTVTRIDRLARSTFELFAIVKRIVDAGGQFRSLAEPWADTATPAPGA
jgi:predicted site-specific integrase-resolvase